MVSESERRFARTADAGDHGHLVIGIENEMFFRLLTRARELRWRLRASIKKRRRHTDRKPEPSANLEYTVKGGGNEMRIAGQVVMAV